MVKVAQLVRALDCGSRGYEFKSHLSPYKEGYSSGKEGSLLNC